jgi:hypothetical protein
MNRCSHVCRDLPLFIGGDLDVGRAAEIGRHLRDCATCRREAVGLQQSLKQLRRIAAPAMAASTGDEALFASMHAAIVDRVDAEIACGVGSAGGGWRGLHTMATHRWGWGLGWAAAAAVVLFVVGWWAVRLPSAPTLLERAPIVVPVRHADANVVVPYAGPRVPLRLLGDEAVSDQRWTEIGRAPGMMGRCRLRSLVGEEPMVPEPGESAAAVEPESPADVDAARPRRGGTK